MKLMTAIAALAVILSTSCARKTAEQQQDPFSRERDSLLAVIQQKDTLLVSIVNDISAISGNLNRIKERENLITKLESGDEQARPMARINRDIEAIDHLLQENNRRLNSLRNTSRQLSRANLKIASLDKMIQELNTDLGNKRQEIGTLKQQLSQREEEVRNLETVIEQNTTEIRNINEEKLELENMLNCVYYIVGQEKELSGAQIINKEGFIGRTLKVSRNVNLESFTKSDSRLLSEIHIGHKKVHIVSSHPAGSYQLVTRSDKVVEKLQITDPSRFWESSKVLVISYK